MQDDDKLHANSDGEPESNLNDLSGDLEDDFDEEDEEEITVSLTSLDDEDGHDDEDVEEEPVVVVAVVAEPEPAAAPAKRAPAKKAPAKIRLSNESFDVAFAKQERGHRVTVTSKHQRDLENLFLAASVLDGERSIDGWAWPRSTWKAGESRMTNLPVNLQGSSFRLSGDARDANGTLYEIECLWPLNP